MYHHVRHLERVCTSSEAAAVRRSSNPVLALAMLWACKEASYKSLGKQFRGWHFVPRRFEAQLEEYDPAKIDKKLSILCMGVQTELRIFAAQGWVHAVTAPPGMQVRWKVREMEERSLGGRKAPGESEAVRFLARELLDELGWREVTLQFDQRIPVLRDDEGKQTRVEVSLAHHGAFAAAAVAWPTCDAASMVGQEVGSTATSPEALCSTCIA